MRAAALAVVEIWSFQERSDPRVTPSIEILSLNSSDRENIHKMKIKRLLGEEGLLEKDDNVFTCKKNTEYNYINKRKIKQNINIGSLVARRPFNYHKPRPNRHDRTKINYYLF